MHLPARRMLVLALLRHWRFVVPPGWASLLLTSLCAGLPGLPSRCLLMHPIALPPFIASPRSLLLPGGGQRGGAAAEAGECRGLACAAAGQAGADRGGGAGAAGDGGAGAGGRGPGTVQAAACGARCRRWAAQRKAHALLHASPASLPVPFRFKASNMLAPLPAQGCSREEAAAARAAVEARLRAKGKFSDEEIADMLTSKARPAAGAGAAIGSRLLLHTLLPCVSAAALRWRYRLHTSACRVSPAKCVLPSNSRPRPPRCWPRRSPTWRRRLGSTRRLRAARWRSCRWGGRPGVGRGALGWEAEPRGAGCGVACLAHWQAEGARCRAAARRLTGATPLPAALSTHPLTRPPFLCPGAGAVRGQPGAHGQGRPPLQGRHHHVRGPYPACLASSGLCMRPQGQGCAALPGCWPPCWQTPSKQSAAPVPPLPSSRPSPKPPCLRCSPAGGGGCLQDPHAEAAGGAAGVGRGREPGPLGVPRGRRWMRSAPLSRLAPPSVRRSSLAPPNPTLPSCFSLPRLLSLPPSLPPSLTLPPSLPPPLPRSWTTTGSRW